MPDKPSDRHLIENEKILREYNTRSKKAIKKLVSTDKSAYDMPIEFACECSNRACSATVPVSIKRYEQVHRRQNRFLVAPGHEMASIEKIVEEDGMVTVVEKLDLKP